jgi:hypothetical protein
MAPTRACLPPYRSRMLAKLCFGSSGAHGFDHTENLVNAE